MDRVNYTDGTPSREYEEYSAKIPEGKVVSLPAWLIPSAKALLALDKENALVPHGIGLHARSIMEEFIKAYDSVPEISTERNIHMFTYDSFLDDEQYARLKQQLVQQFGEGRCLLLEGGIKYHGRTTINSKEP
jgi:hypothetical protein